MTIKNRIKIWPFWDDISASIIPYYDSNLNFKKDLNIDFSEVKYLSSSGCAVILTKLLKIISDHSDKTWNLHYGENNKCKLFLESNGAKKIFEDEILNKNLFWEGPYNSNEKTITLDNKISFPIYRLNHKKSIGRESVENFIDWLIKFIYPYCENTDLRFDIFAKMLKEIAKNSCDHTGDDAFFGIDLINNNESPEYLVFSFCDLGDGIHEKVKNFKEKIGEDWSKKGIVDSYQFAFQPGNTTGGKINKGIGMSMIQECSKILKIDLCVFDANSMGIIPPEIVHSVIRDNFYNTGSSVGFNYFGKIKLKKQ